MFSQGCVKNSVHWKGLSASVHSGMHTPHEDTPRSDTLLGRNTPSRAEAPPAVTAADAMHPAGMHS